MTRAYDAASRPSPTEMSAAARDVEGDVPSPARTVAWLGVAAIGFDLRFSWGWSAALVVAACWLPVWMATLPRYAGARLTLALGSASLLSGVWLTVTVTAADHDVNLVAGAGSALLVLSALGAVGFILWARTVLSLWHVAISYAAGGFLSALLEVAAEDNPWKGALSWPVTVAVLALASRTERTSLQVLAVSLLAAVNAVFDYRSQSALCLVVLALLLGQAGRSRARGPRRGAVPATLLLLTVSLTAAYLGGVALLVGGYAGDELQARSETQIEQSGNILSGGRPEWHATVALMQESPWGFGLGAVPNGGDIQTAKEGLAQLDIPTIGGYVEHYMFSGQFKLHSVTADFWSLFGVLGLALAVVWIVALGRQVVSRVAAGTAESLFLMVTLTGLWHMAFSPVYSNLMDVAFAVGLVLPLVLNPAVATDEPAVDR